MSPMSDRQAADLCRLGETPEDQRRGFRRLYESHARSVYAYAYRMVRDAALADDVTQETFLSVYRNRHRLDPDRSIKAYVLRIAHNAALQQLSRQGRVELRDFQADDRLVDEAAGVISRITERERGQLVEQAMEGMAAAERSILQLRFVEALKLREIAEVLECTERTVRNRLRAALVMLERELRKRGLHELPQEGRS